MIIADVRRVNSARDAACDAQRWQPGAIRVRAALKAGTRVPTLYSLSPANFTLCILCRCANRFDASASGARVRGDKRRRDK